MGNILRKLTISLSDHIASDKRSNNYHLPHKSFGGNTNQGKVLELYNDDKTNILEQPSKKNDDDASTNPAFQDEKNKKYYGNYQRRKGF